MGVLVFQINHQHGIRLLAPFRMRVCQILRLADVLEQVIRNVGEVIFMGYCSFFPSSRQNFSIAFIFSQPFSVFSMRS